MSIKDQGVWIDKPEGTDINSFKDVQYDLFADLIGENLTPKECVKKYRLPIEQIRKIVHKDSTVTEDQFLKWRSLYESNAKNQKRKQ